MKETLNNFNETLDDIFAYIRIGSDKKLLIFDFSIWGMILYDLFAIKSLRLDVYHLSFIQNIWENFSIKYISIAVLLIYIPPILIASLNFLLRDTRPFRNTLPTRYKNIIFIIHFITAIGLSFFMSISSELQLLSGEKRIFDSSGGFSSSTSEYTPLYSTLLIILATIPSLGIIITTIGKFFSDRKKNSKEEFTLWFNLADTSRDYFPKERGDLIFVNTASMAPSINWVNKREESLRNLYQKKVPTSDDARTYLKECSEDSREFLREYLFQDTSDKSTFSIEFLPGTSRGLEVGLTHIENVEKIILSPYEHPGQYNVVKWFAGLKQNIDHTMLEMNHLKLNDQWDTQKKWLIKSINDALPTATDKKVAVLLSEVHYVTGLYINVKEIMEELRPDHRNSNIVFIIDGSQSVGNLKKPFNDFKDCLHNGDFYYFSAHKWLLSPNTCGVLVAKQNDDRRKITPYDIFGKNLPTATIDPGVIFGINASLEYLIGNNMFHFNKFYEKSQLLKTYFKERIIERFEIIESQTKEMNESNFIALRPKKSFKWKDKNVHEFWKEITQAGVDLTLIHPTETGDKTWWLRISFPYFLQLHSLKQLIRHLNNRVFNVNK